MMLPTPFIFSPADFALSCPTILQSYKYVFFLGAFAKIRYICHR